MNLRQKEIAHLIREYILTETDGDLVHITLLYDFVAVERPDLVDDVPRNPPYERTLRWHHDLQWALKNLVAEENPQVVRRPDRGLGWYSAA